MNEPEASEPEAISKLTSDECEVRLWNLEKQIDQLETQRNLVMHQKARLETKQILLEVVMSLRLPAPLNVSPLMDPPSQSSTLTPPT